MPLDEEISIKMMEALISVLDAKGYPTDTIRSFFEVGEWLLAFEGLQNAQKAGAFNGETYETISMLEAYFEGAS